MNIKSFVIYCSPSGTTKHVSKYIEKTLKELNSDIFIQDIGKERNRFFALDQIKAAKEKICLYIGTPVYAGHAVLPVMAFINELPETITGFAVPFATWGGVCSGVALWEMGEKLLEKGYKIAAASKVGAVHSMLWQSKTPVCLGHPDTDDDKLIAEFVIKVHKGLSEGNLRRLQLKDLDYQPELLGSELKKTSINNLMQMLPERIVNENKCTQCGICMEECPADAIDMAPYPMFGENCFGCFNCVRLCPENAIEADLSAINKHIKMRKEQINEFPLT
ncbi:MAG: EFR1 family ferrodoxin, partial [Proteobacteria bacterium]|nr:EFR1 family ferrodoxin [Pseudomonadota bacterium]